MDCVINASSNYFSWFDTKRVTNQPAEELLSGSARDKCHQRDSNASRVPLEAFTVNPCHNPYSSDVGNDLLCPQVRYPGPMRLNASLALGKRDNYYKANKHFAVESFSKILASLAKDHSNPRALRVVV